MGFEPKIFKKRAVDVNKLQNPGKIEGASGFAQKAQEQFDTSKARSETADTQRQGFIGALQGDINKPQGPSLADAQLKAAQDNTLAQQLAVAASARGGNAGLQQRSLAQSQAQLGQGLAQQGVQARLQEQQQFEAQKLAQQQLLGQQIGQSQQQADALTAQYLNAGFSMADAQRKAAFDVEQLRSQEAGLDKQLAAADFNAARQRDLQIGGSLLKGAAGGLASVFSDENLKTDIVDGGKDISDFLSAIGTHKYKYKKGAKETDSGGSGEYISPMAQELEKTKLGKDMVIDTPQGKMVNYGKGFGAILASQAHLFKKISKLEKKNGK